MSDFNLNDHVFRLLQAEPFFAALSRRIEKKASTAVPTAGVRVDEHGYFEMIYNPAFFAGLTDEQRTGVLVHEFYDQDGELVKAMRTMETAELGGRTVASRQRMESAGEEGKWTQIELGEAQYDIEMDKRLFTRSNLRNPRE